MHRVGRDRTFPNFQSSFNGDTSVFVFAYGEVDCRCHVARQVVLGRPVDDVCRTLVDRYVEAIAHHVRRAHQVIVCSVVPTLRRREYEDVHGPVTHEFPYEGTDEERVMYTRRLNDLLRNACLQRGYTYLDVHSLYARDDGTFRYEDSDGICHIYRNEAVLRAFDQALRPLPVQSHPPLGTTAPPPPPSTVRTTARHLPPPRTARRRMGAQRVVAAAPPLLRRAAAAAAPVGRGRGRGRSVAVGIGRRSLGAPPSL